MLYRKSAIAGALWIWAAVTIAGVRTDHRHTHLFWQFPQLGTLIWPLLPGVTLLVTSLWNAVDTALRKKLALAVGVLAIVVTIAFAIVHRHEIENEQNRRQQLAQLVSWQAIPIPSVAISRSSGQASRLDFSLPPWDGAHLILVTSWKDGNVNYRIDLESAGQPITNAGPKVPPMGDSNPQTQPGSTGRPSPRLVAVLSAQQEADDETMRAIADSCRFDIELLDSNGLPLTTFYSVQLNPIIGENGLVARLSGGASEWMSDDAYENVKHSGRWAVKYGCYNNFLTPGIIESGHDRPLLAR